MIDIAYRSPKDVDHDALATMAAASFAKTFAGKITEPDLTAYLQTAYGPSGQMMRDLVDPAIAWRIATRGEDPVGYIKLSDMTLPHLAMPGAMEIRQLYVRDDLHGAGVAATLMTWAVARARERGTPELYLAVFDDNVRAVRFYTRRGFAKVGRFDFKTGSTVHDDGIWRLDL